MENNLVVLNEVFIISEQIVLGKTFRIYGDFENPLFMAKEIAEWIDHNKPSEMIDNIDNDEKQKAIVSHSGQKREMWFLSEDGMYEVLMQSRKPIAKQFKKEVKVVLKSIRKHGAYMTEEVIEKTLTDPDFIIQLATQLKEERIKRIASENKIQEQKLIIAEQKPKVEMADRLFICDGLKNVGEVAKLFNERIRKGKSIGRDRFYEILRTEHILMTFGAEKNNPQQKYIDNGCLVLKTSTFDNGHGKTKMSSTTKVTPKGINWLWNFLIKKGYIIIDDVLVSGEEE